MIVTGIYRYILPYENEHSECSEHSERSERSECSALFEHSTSSEHSAPSEHSASSERGVSSERSASSEHSEPYVELLIWENGEEHMVTVEYDNIGSYFILNDKKYYIKNIGTYFNPVFEIENSGGTDFYLALEECKGKYQHKEQSLQHFKDLYGTGTRAELLAEFIEFAHSRFNLEYEKIFSKFDIESFFDRFGKFLGNYDDRIVRDFLL